MKELSIERLEVVSGGAIGDCVMVGAAILGAITLTYTTGPLWAMAGGWGLWAAGTAYSIDGCSDTMVRRK